MNPVNLGRLALRNPLVIAPMTTYSSLPNGDVADDELTFLARRGDWGAIVTAACCVHPSGLSFDGQWCCWSDEHLPSLGKVARAIQSTGAKALLQIHHGGRMAPSRLCGQSVSASAIPAPRDGAETPRALEIAEIEELVAAFASATRRAAEAGYDGVEIHGANTYLLQQFVSHHSNRRTDEYGCEGLLFNRQIVGAARAAAPRDFALGYRFSPEEKEEPGLDLAQTGRLLAMLGEQDLDFLHISLGNYAQCSLRDPSLGAVLPRVLEMARQPLIGVGSVWTRADADAVLKMGCAAVAVGRGALTDPDFATKVLRDEMPRATLPAENFGETCVLPAGLAAKIEAVPGWIPRDAPTS